MILNIGDNVKKYNKPNDYVKGTVIALHNDGRASVKLLDGHVVEYPMTSLFHDSRI